MFNGGIGTLRTEGNDRLDFQTNGNNTRMTILESGLVGIGTTNPDHLLELNGGALQFNQDHGIGFRAENAAPGPGTVDGARMYYDNNVFGGSLDALVIEKTDFNHLLPDGGLAFANRGSDNVRQLSLCIRGSGNVGIATPDPTSALSVNGDANKIGGGAWAVFSDQRLKRDITPYTEGLELITAVRPVSFSYNEEMQRIWGKNETIRGKVFQGVIAQELRAVAPDMVREVRVPAADGTGTETVLEVDPNRFTYALINAVKQQQERIEALENTVRTQSSEHAALKALVELLLARTERLGGDRAMESTVLHDH
jgi:hypothetical protein